MAYQFGDDDRTKGDGFDDFDFGGSSRTSPSNPPVGGKDSRDVNEAGFMSGEGDESLASPAGAAEDSAANRMWDDESQFATQPVEIVESSDAFAFGGDGREEDAHHEHLDSAHEDGHADHAFAATPEGKSKAAKPNYAILGVAALAGLGLLGGGGYIAASMLGLTGGGSASSAITPIPMASGSSVFNFDDLESDVEPLPQTSDIAGVNGGVSFAEATVSSGTTDSGAVMAQVDALLSQPVQPAEPPAAVAPQAAAPASVAPAANAAAAPVAPSPSVAPATPVITGSAATAQAGSQAASRAPSPAARPAAAPAPRPASAAARPATREAVRDTTVQVVAVYPQSGRFAQAWLRDQDGRLISVREGDSFMGAQIRAIHPERMEVETADGRFWGPNRVVVSSTRPS